MKSVVKIAFIALALALGGAMAELLEDDGGGAQTEFDAAPEFGVADAPPAPVAAPESSAPPAPPATTSAPPTPAAVSPHAKPRIAFYFYGQEPKAGVFRPLGGEITKAIVRSGEFVAVDRTDAVRELITGEQLYQRSGAVDESQVSVFGKQWGVKYVISIEIATTVGGNFFVEAKMVDVEGAFIANMGTVTTRLDTDRDIVNAAGRIINELIGQPQQTARTGARDADRAAREQRAREEREAREQRTREEQEARAQRMGERRAARIEAMDRRKVIAGARMEAGSLTGPAAVASWPIVKDLYLDAGVGLFFGNVDAEDHRYDFDTYEGITVPITATFNTRQFTYLPLYVQAGFQLDIPMEGGPSGGGLVSGIPVGAGLMFRFWPVHRLDLGVKYVYCPAWPRGSRFMFSGAVMF